MQKTNVAADIRQLNYMNIAEDEINEPREANELEKAKASAAVDNILSVLTHYSEHTGRLVCGKRCCSTANSRLISSLNISLGRIKQSFVL